MTGPKGNSEFFFPETLKHWGQGETKLTVSHGTIIKRFVIPTNSKLAKTTKKPFAFLRLAHKFAAISRSTIWSRASRISQGSWCSP